MPPGPPNPDTISDQKMSFLSPVFKPGLESPYPFLGLELVTKRNIHVYIEQKLCHHW